MMLNVKKIPWRRRTTQLVFLWILGEYSFYGIFRCPFAVPYVSCGSCPVVQCPGRKIWLFFWIGMGLSALFCGRAFCSWACPAGFISDMFCDISFFKDKITSIADRIMSYGKYITLTACIVIFSFFNNPRWAIPIRTGEFWNSAKLTFEHADALWLVRTCFVLTGLLFLFLVPRFWCRYLCPTGGLLEAVKGLALFSYRQPVKCNKCNSCRTACVMETLPEENNCINCGDCRNACPQEKIILTTKRPGNQQHGAHED